MRAGCGMSLRSPLRPSPAAGRDWQLAHAGTAATANSGIWVSCAHQAGDAAQAEAGAEAVDEMGELGVVGRAVAARARLHRLAALRDERGEPHHVEAEAGIAGVADRGEPVGEQAGDAGGVAQRRAGADLDAVDLVVGAEQRDLQQPRAVLAPLHGGAELGGEPRDGAEHVAFERRSDRRSAARPHRTAPAGAA